MATRIDPRVENTDPDEALQELAATIRDDLKGLLVPKPWLKQSCRLDLSRLGKPKDEFPTSVTRAFESQPIVLHITGHTDTLHVLPGPVIYRSKSTATTVQIVYILNKDQKILPAAFKFVSNEADEAQTILNREKVVASHLIARDIVSSLVRPYAVCNEGILYELIAAGDDLRTINLAEALRTKAVDQLEWLRIMIQVAQTMVAVHRDQLMYLDLTPKNVFLDRNKHAYLGDFASIRRYGELIDPEEGFICTPGYYDPALVIEQQRLVGAQDISDKRAFGILIKHGLREVFHDVAIDSPGIRKLHQLGERLIDGINHPFVRRPSDQLIDGHYISWEEIVKYLSPVEQVRRIA